MSRKGNCLDNAVAENFFGIMKTELLYAENFESAEAFMKALEEYIDFFNNKRIKSRLKGKLITCPTFGGISILLGVLFMSNFVADNLF